MKTSCARIFAKTINCLNPTADGEACGECESCKAIEKGNSFNLVELDAASNNSVDDIRSITEQVNIPAQDGRYRVFIIDEVHMLSNSAFNAFLKTLEEPPKNVVFILATTERHKVIPTILSRCQVYDFRRITVEDIIDHLQYVAESEGVKAQREALGVIALKADGAMRDALSIFDQVAASTHGDVTYQGTIDALNVLDQDYYFRLIDIFKQGDVAEALLTFKEITDKGFDAQFFINGLAEHIRNLMVSADPRTVKLLETSEEMGKRYSEQAPSLPVEWYYTAMKLLNDADFNYKTSGNKRLLVELTLIRLSRLLKGAQGIAVPFVAPDGDRPQAAPAPKPEAREKIERAPVTSEKKTDSGASVRKPSVSRPTSFRLNANQGSSASLGDSKPHDTAFTAEQFMKVWEGYMTSHPEQRILVSAMRGSSPTKEDEITYKVTVDHPAQKQAFESSWSELMEYLKRELDNDHVRLLVEVSDRETSDKKMNSKDFLKLVIEENQVLAKFLKAIDAELE